MTNQNPLPRFSQEQFNTLDVLKAHAQQIANGYAAYVESIENLKQSHDSYHDRPTLKSQELCFRSALINYEAAQVLISEVKDLMNDTGIDGLMP